MDEVEHVGIRVGTGMQGVMITRSVCRAAMRVLKCKHMVVELYVRCEHGERERGGLRVW